MDKKTYNKIDKDTEGVNHPIQTNSIADYNNTQSIINISVAENDEQEDQI